MPRLRDTETRILPAYAAGSVEVPYVIHGMMEHVERDVEWPAHSHPTHELLWNERGASTVTIGARVWTIGRSIGVWMPAGVLHSGFAPAGTWYRTAQFDVRVAPALADEPVGVEVSPLLRLLLDRLDDRELGDESRALTEDLVLDVLKPAAGALVVQRPTDARLQPIADALMADPGDPRTLAEWAETLGRSTRTITRAFADDTGLGFSQWQAAVRMQRAIMLIGSGLRVDDVAERVGYASASAFGAAFRRTTGLSPSAFR
jgi:AraC-like DNA-binding protein